MKALRFCRRLSGVHYSQLQGALHVPACAPLNSLKVATGSSGVPAVSRSLATPLWPSGSRTASSCSSPPKYDEETQQASDEVDKLLGAAAKENSIDKINKIIDTDGDHFTEANVACAFGKLGKLASDKDAEAVVSSRGFQTLVDMVLLGVRRYSTPQLLAVLGACGKLGFDDDMLLDKISTHLLQKINDLDAQNLHDLVVSLGDLDSPSIALFDALQQRAEELDQDLTAEQKAGMKHAYERLGYTDLAKKVQG